MFPRLIMGKEWRNFTGYDEKRGSLMESGGESFVRNIGNADSLVKLQRFLLEWPLAVFESDNAMRDGDERNDFSFGNRIVKGLVFSKNVRDSGLEEDLDG